MSLRTLTLFIALNFFFLPAISFAVPDTDSDGISDGQEVIDGTDPSDPDSVLDHHFTEYCEDWNGFLNGLAQIFEIRNRDCGAATLQVDLRDASGTVQDTRTLTLAASSELDIIISALHGFNNSSYGTICATISSGDPDSLSTQVSYYNLSNSGFQYAFSSSRPGSKRGAQSVGFNHYFPSVNASELNYPVLGYLQLYNAEATVQTGMLLYYSDAGSLLTTVNVSLPAKGRLDVGTHDNVPNTSKVGLVIWQPDNSFDLSSVQLNRYYFGNDGSLKGAAVMPARSASGHTMAAPFSTTNRFAVLELSNAHNSQVQVNVSTYANTGSATSSQPGTITLAAHASRHLILNDYLSSGLGTVKFSSSTAQSVLGTVMEYAIFPDGTFSFANTGVPAAAFGSFASGGYNNYLGGCHVRLTNANSSQQTATVSMNRSDGTALSIASPVTVPGNGALDVNLCPNETVTAYGQILLTPSVTESISGEIVRSNLGGAAEFHTPLTPLSICASSTTTLSASVSSLALSVSDPGTNAALSGTPRQITITNTGSTVAHSLNINFPTWPTGTSASSTCAASLAPAQSCTITVTPGSAPTGTAGIAPTPGTVTVSGSNTNTVTTDVVVLTYGNIYQGGYLFAVDDTTPATGSIGGKVATTTDQAAAFPAGVVWASDGSSSSSVDFFNIPGIDETSTTLGGGCNGATDGACDSAQILAHYAGTNLSFYAAGLCAQTISGFNDWYLPAICEAAYGAAGCGSAGTPLVQNMQSNLVEFSSLNLLSGIYWTSTESSSAPTVFGFAQSFDTSSPLQISSVKSNLAGVRCARALTN